MRIDALEPAWASRMKMNLRILLGGILTAAMLIVVFADPANAGLRFFAKLAIVGIVLAVSASMAVTRFCGRDFNRRLWGSLALVAFSFTLTVMAAELVIRVMFHDVGTTADNSSYFASRWYEKHPAASNSMGFREREFATRKSPGRYRIAIIGDSFTFGQGVLDEERFSNLLQHRLDQAQGDHEVLNFGRSGTETDEHLRMFEDTVLDLSPDFVLLQWFVNDVEVIRSRRAVPLRLIPSDYLSSWLHRRSALYYLANRQWIMLQGALGLSEPYIDNMTRRFSDPDGEEWQAAATALDKLLGRLREVDISAGMVLFPMMIDAGGDPDAYPVGFLMDRVLAICATHDTECLDLRPVFAGSLSEADLWANRLDHHPGVAAHRVASEAIFNRFGATWNLQ